MDTHVVLLCFLCHYTQECFVTGIGSMRSQAEAEPVAILKCISFRISLVKAAAACFIITAAYQAAAYHSSHAAFLYGTGRLHDVHLHIIKAGGTALHHFKYGQIGSPICILIRHLLLDGIHTAEEPVHKGKVICHITHERHI